MRWSDRAYTIESAARNGYLRIARTVAIFTATWKQGCILAVAKVQSRSAANAMY